MRHLHATDGKTIKGAALLMAYLAAHAAGALPSRAGEPPPTTLKTETQQAFERYVKLTDTRNEEELNTSMNALWVDALPERQRSRAFAELKRGEVKMERLETLDGGKPIRCPSGMIHHWTGVVFIPGAKLDDVLSVLQDYDNHSVYFAPDVERSKIDSREGDHFRVFLRFRRHKVITVVLNTVHDVNYFHDAPGMAHSRSSTVRVAEVENGGKSDEREKPPGADNGFMWRMETWWRMVEREDGVYLQSEVVSLTRDIPTGLGWLIRPFITSIPKESLTFTLEAARKAVQGRIARQ